MQETILVVEDEKLDDQDLRMTLESLGYKVLVIADTGSSAIQETKTLRPNLVLMNTQKTGEVDSITATKEILQHLEIPVIYVTADPNEDLLEGIKAIAPYGYIIKPFEEKELQTAIEIALDHHKRQQQLRENARLLETTLKSIADGVIVVDCSGRITFINPTAEAIALWPSQEALGREGMERLKLIDEQTRTPIPNPFAQALSQNCVVSSPARTLLICQDRREIPIDFTCSPIAGEHQIPQGAILVFRDMSKRQSEYDSLRHQAFHDPLTGLANRTHLVEQLEAATERFRSNPKNRFAVLFLDLDRFKHINDTLGHAQGDQLLVIVAQRLQHCLRPSDTVARWGGDEFAILLENLHSFSQAKEIARRVQQTLRMPIDLNGHTVFPGASIGIVFSSLSYQQGSDLIRDADLAMYRVKARGGGCCEIFTPKMRGQVRALQQLEQELYQAIERHELKLHYQPIVSLKTGAVASVEALVRWYHPRWGMLLPAEFLPVMRDVQSIVRLNGWILEQACRQLRQWQEHYLVQLPLAMHVNLSRQQFTQPNLALEIEQILARTGLGASYLNLEFTEAVLLEKPKTAARICSQLKALGVGMSLDDFGMGYSSLRHLHHLPLDALKIDRSLIARLNSEQESNQFARTIVALGQMLGIEVIAEGVETSTQLIVLEQLGCELVQGNLFSKPLSPESATKFIEFHQKFLSEQREKIPQQRTVICSERRFPNSSELRAYNRLKKLPRGSNRLPRTRLRLKQRSRLIACE